jgi:hypothetical protein
MIFREVDEPNHLAAFDRRKSLEKILYGEVLFEVVNQCLYRNPRALEAGSPLNLPRSTQMISFSVACCSAVIFRL